MPPLPLTNLIQNAAPIASSTRHRIRESAGQLAVCSLCSKRFGSRYGFLWRQRRAEALARGGVGSCQPCLENARQILRRHESHPSTGR
jgi:hypothetical protein